MFCALLKIVFNVFGFLPNIVINFVSDIDNHTTRDWSNQTDNEKVICFLSYT